LLGLDLAVFSHDDAVEHCACHNATARKEGFFLAPLRVFRGHGAARGSGRHHAALERSMRASVMVAPPSTIVHSRAAHRRETSWGCRCDTRWRTQKGRETWLAAHTPRSSQSSERSA